MNSKQLSVNRYWLKSPDLNPENKNLAQILNNIKLRAVNNSTNLQLPKYTFTHKPIINHTIIPMKKYLMIFTSLLLFACESNQETADAYGHFEADDVIVSSEANGRVLAMFVEEDTMTSSASK